MCPRCKAAHFWKLDGWLLVECENGHKVGLTVGSFMDGSHLNPGVWALGTCLLWESPGISVAEFQRLLGLTRYQTASTMLARMRGALAGRPPPIDTYADVAVLQIPVRSDRKRRRTVPVLAIVESWLAEDDSPQRGAVWLERVPPEDSETWMAGRIRRAIASDATVRADLAAFAAASRTGFELLVPAPTDREPKILGGVRSELEIWLLRVHHGPVAEVHLQGYLDEFTVRLNVGGEHGFWRVFLWMFARSCAIRASEERAGKPT